MRKFNLEEALAGAAIVTRGNEPAMLEEVDREADKPVIAAILFKGEVKLFNFHLHGKYFKYASSTVDLMMKD